MFSWKLCHGVRQVFVDLAPNCLPGSCKFLFFRGVSLNVSISPCYGDGLVAPVATGIGSVSCMELYLKRPMKTRCFFNRTTENTAMNEQVGCGEERRRGGVGGGCWRCGILPRGGPYGRGGVCPTDRTFFLPFSPILFGCIAGWGEIKIPAS